MAGDQPMFVRVHRARRSAFPGRSSSESGERRPSPRRYRARPTSGRRPAGRMTKLWASNDRRCTAGIGATALRDPWDASSPTWRSRRPSVFGLLQLLQVAAIFSLGTMGSLQCFAGAQTSLLNSTEEGKKSRGGNG